MPKNLVEEALSVTADTMQSLVSNSEDLRLEVDALLAAGQQPHVLRLLQWGDPMNTPVSVLIQFERTPG